MAFRSAVGAWRTIGVVDIEIPEPVQDIIVAAAEIFGSDNSLVLVGGSVRDLLLGNLPKDYDFATALLPEEVEARLRAAGKRPHTIGKRFGTVGFRHEGRFIEVTTYRKELYDMQSRKPQVAFTAQLEEDLARRDFTINAMALTLDCQLIDPFGGEADLQAGIIRAVGSPAQRFREDPLRMLRMIRFVARFGFDIDQITAKEAARQAHSLVRISTERISVEMDGILPAPHSATALRRMAELGLLSFAVPLLAVQVGYDQNSPHHQFTLWEHSLKTMAGVEPDLELRWAALLHDIGKPFVRREKLGRSTYVHHDIVGGVLVDMTAKHLKWPKDRTERVCELVCAHMSDDSPIRSADNAAK